MSNPGEEMVHDTPETEAEEVEAATVIAEAVPVWAEVVAKMARIYPTPSLAAAPIKTLTRGEEVPVVGVAGGNVWIQIGPDQWIPFALKGKQYLAMKDK